LKFAVDANCQHQGVLDVNFRRNLEAAWLIFATRQPAMWLHIVTGKK